MNSVNYMSTTTGEDKVRFTFASLPLMTCYIGGEEYFLLIRNKSMREGADPIDSLTPLGVALRYDDELERFITGQGATVEPSAITDRKLRLYIDRDSLGIKEIVRWLFKK